MAKFDKGTPLDTQDLENVAGGTYFDSMQVCQFLDKAGYKDLLKGGLLPDMSNMRTVLNDMGINAHDKGGLSNGNTYTMDGKTLNQEQLMNILQEKFPNVKTN